MRSRALLVALCLSVLSVSTALVGCESVQRSLDRTLTVVDNMDMDTDRPGGDFDVFAMRGGDGPQTCYEACTMNERCRTWAYFAATEDRSAMCHLKDEVPAPVPCEECASGVLRPEAP